MDHHAHDKRAPGCRPGMRQPSGQHTGHEMTELSRRFWIVLALTIPVIVYSAGIQKLLHFTPPQFPFSQYVPFVLATIIFFYGGTFFLKGAAAELGEHRPGMMTLVSLAIIVSFVYSLLINIGLPGEVLYWELSTLIMVMLLGHWMEMRAVSSGSGALQELAKLMPDKAERILTGGTEIIPVTELRVDDIVLIRPGSNIPADGEVVSGESSVNEAMLTGESRPVAKVTGSAVIAGTINGEGSLRVHVTKTGGDTALAGIMCLVDQAQSSRTYTQNLADTAAYWLTLIAISASAVTFAYWYLSPVPKSFALERAVTVLVIACPHALGLAIPLVIAVSTALAAKNGLLVRNRLALEKARNLNIVVFDKTGTLTEGRFGVVGVYVVSQAHEAESLAVIAAAEKDSEHIVAKAIVKTAHDRHLWLPDVTDFKSIPGLGVQANVGGRDVRVGGENLLESLNLDLPTELKLPVARARDAGQTIVFLIEADCVTAAVALADLIRMESVEAVRQLKKLGIEVAMMTGDSEDVARSVAEQLGIQLYYANVLPEEKARRIEEMRSRRLRVAMVGDGVNDAPALVSADVGIAIGAGTDVAVEAGDIILVRNDPRDVVKVIRLSQASYDKMIENLLWATGYNIIAIPLAAGLLVGHGIILPPAVGALFMSVSTVIVAANAQLLRGLNLQDL